VIYYIHQVPEEICEMKKLSFTEKELSRILKQDDYYIKDEFGGGVSDDVLVLNPDYKPQRASCGKYNNVITETADGTFHSKLEADYYAQLKILERVGQVRELKTQVHFVLQDAYSDDGGVWHQKIEYIADFVYFDTLRKRTVVADTKGVQTATFRLKYHLFCQKDPEYVFEIVGRNGVIKGKRKKG
jgi:hypothetical protein